MANFFIRRPIATSLLMGAIAMFGIIAYRALPVSDLPQVDYPTLNVNASLPGADPSTMASAVASPLERQFTTIAGLDSMTSSSNAGFTNVTLQFNLDRDIDSAAVDVQTAIEFFSTKIGLVLLVLGAMHFFNLRTFSRMRQRNAGLPDPLAASSLSSAVGRS